MKELSQLFTKESPRRIIFEDFKIDLPISGGWGYDFNTACVIEKNDPSVVQGVPFDWMSIEYAFIEKRIYEEMIIFRNVKEKFAGIRWNLFTASCRVITSSTPFNCLMPWITRALSELSFK